MAVDYLRLSLTDHCNLDCFYCNPLDKDKFLKHDDMLSLEDLARVIRLMVPLGLKKVRLTGGEPLLKKGLFEAVSMFRSIEGIEELSMTTNGILLKYSAGRLKQAGLDRVNISIDTLDKNKFIYITGKDGLDDVLAGIKSALEASLVPVKLNVLLLGGINDNEIADFVRLTVDKPLHVRFIELFKTSRRLKNRQVSTLRSMQAKELIEREFGELKHAGDVVGNGPAEYVRIAGAHGTLGFISNLSKNFCGDCNRLRMDATGRIAPCLFSGYLYELKPLLRLGDEAVARLLEEIFENKYKYNKHSDHISDEIEMSSVGG